MAFPPPPPPLCHDYDTITEKVVQPVAKPAQRLQVHSFASSGDHRSGSPSMRLTSPQPPLPREYSQYDNTERALSPQQQQQHHHQPPTVVMSSHTEMQYGIIVKPPVPSKPRLAAGPLSPQGDDMGMLPNQPKPAPPPRTSQSATARNAAPNNRALVDITGELDKLLSARAARLEQLWNQEEGRSAEPYPPPASLLMASQELTSEETGTIKKRPPPPPRRN